MLLQCEVEIFFLGKQIQIDHPLSPVTDIFLSVLCESMTGAVKLKVFNVLAIFTRGKGYKNIWALVDTLDL